MRLSEVIRQLNSAIDQYGDQEVFLEDGEGYGFDPVRYVDTLGVVLEPEKRYSLTTYNFVKFTSENDANAVRLVVS